jgi:two-component system LytT family response regulator
MTQYTTLIIDDEEPARIRLRRLLAEYNATINIIDEAVDGIEALKKIGTLKPDLIFLDIQMPGLDGFEVLEKIAHLPIIIFTTAFDQYALKAFKTNSVDYLLKPIEPEHLQQAICKLERLNNTVRGEHIRKIIEYAHQIKPRKEISSFPVKTGDTIHLVRVSEVAYLEAKDKYVTIHTIDNKEYVSDVSLKVMEEKLPGNFLRVHRAIIVNKSSIVEIHKYFQGKFVFILSDKNNTKVTSGSSFSDIIKDTMEQL